MDLYTEGHLKMDPYLVPKHWALEVLMGWLIPSEACGWPDFYVPLGLTSVNGTQFIFATFKSLLEAQVRMLTPAFY